MILMNYIFTKKIQNFYYLLFYQFMSYFKSIQFENKKYYSVY